MTTLQLPGGANKVIVGNASAWALSFHAQGPDDTIVDPKGGAFHLSSDRYPGKIDATLPGHLEGGSYSFVIEGLTEEDYARIAQTDSTDVKIVKLFLFWQEANLRIGAYLNNMVGVTDFAGPDPINKDFLVATLWIKKVARKAGTKRYETTIEAQELVFHQLATALVGPLQVPLGLVEAAKKVAKDARTPINTDALVGMQPLKPDPPKKPKPGTTDPDPKPEAKGDDKRTYPPKKTYGDAIIDIATAALQQTKKAGRGQLLIRDGVLYIGPRPIPFSTDPKKAGDPKDLTPASGLVADPTLKDRTKKDPQLSEKGLTGDLKGGGGGGDSGGAKGAGADAGAKGGADTGAKAGGDSGGGGGGGGGGDDEPGTDRRQFEVILKGRPDIKPGDVVRVDVPKADVGNAKGFFGRLADATINNFSQLLPDISGLSADAVSLYVSSVKHQLGVATGFVTTLNGVELKDKDKPWDPFTVSDKAQKDESKDGSADPAVDAAKLIKQAVQDTISGVRTVEVGEVRKFTKKGDKDAEPPAQTETLWRGLALGDGRRGQARRLPIERAAPDVIDGIAYATPFAWGNCGLVLPRYPGARVVIAHRDGDYTDPIEMGAIWQSGHAPQEGETGDWWLILPVGATSPESLPDNDTPPPEHSGPASNDLIDANGNRVIEVGEFVVRVGRSSLANAGKRPQRAESADSITIEHVDGKAKIVIDKDGGILIDAGDKDITMKANNVKVQVKGTMDVSGG